VDILPPTQLPDPDSLRAAWLQGVETPRLALKPLSGGLEQEWLDLHEDPMVAKFVVGPALTPADCWRDLAFAIGHSVLRGFSMWAVFEKASGDFIGRVGPWMPEGWPALEIGWAIGPAGRGQGYGYECACAALSWSWTHLKVPTAIHSIHPENQASKALALKLGAKQLGTADISGDLHEVWLSDLAAFEGARRQGRAPAF
jgi:RimJ/RimL family protein N-acetyltransferase